MAKTDGLTKAQREEVARLVAAGIDELTAIRIVTGNFVDEVEE